MSARLVGPLLRRKDCERCTAHEEASLSTPELQRLILKGVECSTAEREKFHIPIVSQAPEER